MGRRLCPRFLQFTREVFLEFFICAVRGKKNIIKKLLRAQHFSEVFTDFIASIIAGVACYL